jgi:hypothetical protein
MASRERPRRPAQLSRWAASGLTAVVTVGAVGAMAESAPDESIEDIGVALGVVARYEGTTAAAMMAAADPGLDNPAPPPPPTIGRAGVS